MYGPARGPVAPLLLALLAASCAPGRTATLIPLRVSGLPTPAALPAISAGPDQLVPLPDGPTAFAAIGHELADAHRSIQLEMYEFQRPDLAALLVNAKERGVTVTAIADPTERSSRATWARLAQAGVEVIAFPVEARTIDHVKLLIVDDSRAIVGGINWGRRSPANHDFDVLAVGPVVVNLERVFLEDLLLAGHPGLIPPAVPDPRVQVLPTRPGEAIRNAALAAIDGARRSVVLEMFDLSDRLILESLSAALSRGVQVRALLEPTQPQNVEAMAQLRAAGATVRFFAPQHGELLHAKLGIVDEHDVLFGSCNWTRSGFTRNHELDLFITDSTVAGVFLAQADRDWATMSRS